MSNNGQNGQNLLDPETLALKQPPGDKTNRNISESSPLLQTPEIKTYGQDNLKTPAWQGQVPQFFDSGLQPPSDRKPMQFNGCEIQQPSNGKHKPLRNGEFRPPSSSEPSAKSINKHGDNNDDDQGVHCEPCREEGVERAAVGRCIDCREYLCWRCYDSHTIPKPSRNHQLQRLAKVDGPILVGSHPGLGQQVYIQDKSTEPCPSHETQAIEYYCSDHHQLCCTICLNLDHRTCHEALYIPFIAKDLTSNPEYQQAEKNFQEVLLMASNITYDIKQSTNRLESTCNQSLSVVREFRHIINQNLEKVEEEIEDEAKLLKAENLCQLETVTEHYARARAELEAAKVRMDSLREAGQTCNLYIEMMRSESKVRTLQAQIRTAEHELFYKKRQVQFSPNIDMLETLGNSDVFGHVSEVGTTSRTEYMGDIYVKTGADRFNCFITGLVVLPDARVVLTDHSNATIKLVDLKNDHLIVRKKLYTYPWDVAMVTSKQVVISLPFAQQLAFVSITNTIAVTGKLPVDGKCYGVDFRDDMIAVSFCEPSQVQILHLQGGVLYRITTDKLDKQIFNNPLYVTLGLDNTTLYISNNFSRSITCVTVNGNVVATYTDSQLVDPRKVDLDPNGDVYVCAYGSNSIHHITADCKKIGELLTIMDGLNGPHSISYCWDEKRLYVGTSDNTVRVYQAILGSE